MDDSHDKISMDYLVQKAFDTGQSRLYMLKNLQIVKQVLLKEDEKEIERMTKIMNTIYES